MFICCRRSPSFSIKAEKVCTGADDSAVWSFSPSIKDLINNSALLTLANGRRNSWPSVRLMLLQLYGLLLMACFLEWCYLLSHCTVWMGHLSSPVGFIFPILWIRKIFKQLDCNYIRWKRLFILLIWNRLNFVLLCLLFLN